jgi:hypothetical protein
MQKKPKVYAAAFATLLLIVLAINLSSAAIATPQSTSAINNSEIASSAITAAKTPVTSNVNPTTNPPTNTESKQTQSQTTEQSQIQKMKEELPRTLQEAQIIMPNVRTRYLLYTNDGVHIMWGVFGNGHFIGADNQGKSCWGIYGQGIFAGFYDGQFFWGKYSNTGTWKAEFLFGLRVSEGKYVVFPSPIASVTTNTP